jgi:hypothetical protein
MFYFELVITGIFLAVLFHEYVLLQYRMIMPIPNVSLSAI